MAYPEPSMSDCGAPWNMDEYEDPETGELEWICSCTKCVSRRKKEARAEAMCE